MKLELELGLTDEGMLYEVIWMVHEPKSPRWMVKVVHSTMALYPL